MEYKKLDTARYLVRLDPGDEIVASLAAFAEKEGLALAAVQGLGAVNHVVMGVYDVRTQTFKANTMDGVFEMPSLLGTMDTMNGKPYSHFHISIADVEGKAYGGHLKEAVISATAEIVVTLMEGGIDRVKDPRTGLNIWKF